MKKNMNYLPIVGSFLEKFSKNTIILLGVKKYQQKRIMTWENEGESIRIEYLTDINSVGYFLDESTSKVQELILKEINEETCQKLKHFV